MVFELVESACFGSYIVLFRKDLNMHFLKVNDRNGHFKSLGTRANILIVRRFNHDCNSCSLFPLGN